MKRRRQAGQALVLAAVGLTVLMLAAGLSIDMGYLRYQKRRMQTAADSAALAGAAELGYDTNCSANVDSSLNGFTDPTGIAGCPGANTVTGTSTVTVTCATGLVATFSAAPCTSATPYVRVTVSQNQPTFFMRIAGYTSVPLSAKATGYSSTGCIYALSSDPDSIQMAYGGQTDPPPTVPSPGFVIYPQNTTPETIVVAPGCSLRADGTLNLPDNGGGGKSHYLYTASAGGTTLNDPGNTNEMPPASRLVSASDPLQDYISANSGSIPGVSSCATPGQIPPNAIFSSGTVPPGSYPCGLEITGAGIVTLDGVYSLGGSGAPCPTQVLVGSGVTFGNSCSLSIISTGTVQTDTGVMFYNSASGGSIAINYGASLAGGCVYYCGATVQLYPTGGGIPGVLFYQDPANTQPSSITLAGYNGASPPSSYLWGALYFPHSQLSLYGIGAGKPLGQETSYCSSTPRLTTVVAYKLVLDGNLNFNSDDCDWTWPNTPTPYKFPFQIPELIKASAVLVE